MRDVYLDAMLEAAGAASFVPFLQEITFQAMMLWGGYDIRQAVGCVIAGAVMGVMFNYGVGRIAAFIRTQHPEILSDQRYAMWSGRMRRYGVFLLPFFWLPFGDLVTLLAGFFRLSWWVVVALTVLGAGVHYIRVVLI